ncbi:MAG: hypothetical protein B7Z47_02280 [Chthoniobacter sp. 12-60-6]|nr:MAG: hypothetical protein B7Z47_02280 [Chthoniobacter sp. 12-60-6]
MLRACGFRCGLFIGHALSHGTLLLRCQLLLLLHRSGLLGGHALLLRDSFRLLACFLSLSARLLRNHALLLRCGLRLLTRFLSLSGCLLCCHALLLGDSLRLLPCFLSVSGRLLGGHTLLLRHSFRLLTPLFNLSGSLLRCHALLLRGGFRLLTRFLSLSGRLLSGHALLGGCFALLRSRSLHAGLFGFSRRRGLFGSPLPCLGTFFQITPLAVLHCGTLGLIFASTPADSSTGCIGIGRRLLPGHLRHGCWRSYHGGGCGPSRRFSRLAFDHC